MSASVNQTRIIFLQELCHQEPTKQGSLQTGDLIKEFHKLQKKEKYSELSLKDADTEAKILEKIIEVFSDVATDPTTRPPTISVVGETLRKWKYFDQMSDEQKSKLKKARQAFMKGPAKILNSIQECILSFIKKLSGNIYPLHETDRNKALSLLLDIHAKLSEKESDLHSTLSALQKSLENLTPADGATTAQKRGLARFKIDIAREINNFGATARTETKPAVSAPSTKQPTHIELPEIISEEKKELARNVKTFIYQAYDKYRKVLADREHYGEAGKKRVRELFSGASDLIVKMDFSSQCYLLKDLITHTQSNDTDPAERSTENTRIREKIIYQALVNLAKRLSTEEVTALKDAIQSEKWGLPPCDLSDKNNDIIARAFGIAQKQEASPQPKIPTENPTKSPAQSRGPLTIKEVAGQVEDIVSNTCAAYRKVEDASTHRAAERVQVLAMFGGITDTIAKFDYSTQCYIIKDLIAKTQSNTTDPIVKRKDDLKIKEHIILPVIRNLVQTLPPEDLTRFREDLQSDKWGLPPCDLSNEKNQHIESLFRMQDLRRLVES
jgi:hypothetical protein